MQRRVLDCLVIMTMVFATCFNARATLQDNGDGTVTDTRTGLTWMRCAQGQSGSDCSGSATLYTWANAAPLTLSYAGHGDWRIPTMSELLSIVDSTVTSPSIDSIAFPNTAYTSGGYWTSTVEAAGQGYVVFDTGNAYYAPVSGYTERVRFVRGTSTLTNGLVGYWNFENCDGYDSSGGGNNGTLVGSPTCNETAGKVGKGLLQHNLSQYIDLGSNISVGSAFSFSGWYRLTGSAGPQWHAFFLSNSYCNSGNAFGAMYEQQSSIIRLYDGSNCLGTRTISYSLPSDQWFHFSLTYDGASISTYIDGTKIDSFPYSGAVATSPPFIIGANLSPLTYNWQGNIDEVRIYNRALASPEVAALAGRSGVITTFSDGFNGTRLDGSKWREIRFGANAVSEASGLVHFPALTVADTCGKTTFTGSSDIVIESRFAGQGSSRDTHIEIIDADTGSLIQVGDSNYWSGIYVQGTGIFSIAPHRFASSVNVFKEYRLTFSGATLTVQRGDSLSTLNESTSVTFPASVVGKTFYLRIGTASPDYSPADFDWIRVVAAPGVINSNCDMTGVSNPITPTAARVDVLQQFTVTGTGFTGGTLFAVENCTDATMPVLTGTTQAVFSCIPRRPGPAALRIDGVVVSGASVFVDQPIRTGDPARGGIPSVKGVSLWNGNYHHQVVDMEVPALGVPFTVSRAYNSYYWDYERQRGGVDNYRPWRFNWDIGIGHVGGDPTQIYVQREDGSGSSYFLDTGVWYPMDPGNFDDLRVDVPVSGQTTLFTRAGLKYVFQNPPDGKLIGVYDHDGHGLTVSRDGSGQIDHVTDATGRTYQFVYDGSSGRLLSVTDFTGRKVEYTWRVDNPANDPAADPPLRWRIKTVKGVRHTLAEPVVTTYNYTSYGPDTAPRVFLTGIVDARANTAVTLTYRNDVYGNWGVASVTDAAGSTWSFGYCAEKDVAGACDTTDKAISFRTDVTAPIAASSFKAHFDTAGRYTGKTDALAHRSIVTPHPLTALTARTYNFAGLTTGSATPLNHQTSYTYHSSGSVATRTQADGGVREVKGWQAEAIANNLYLATEAWSPACAAAGQACVKQYSAFDAAGKPTSRRLGSLPATTHAYQAGTALLSSTSDPLGKTTEFEYDSHGYLALTRNTLPGSDIRESQYVTDSLGRVTARIDPRGVRTEMSYDAAGNVLSETVDPGTPPAQLNLRTQYGYDANGNQVSRTDPNGNTVLTDYDAANRPWRVRQTVAGAAWQTNTSYDALGRVVGTTNANSHSQTTAYDAAGNVASRSDALPRTTSYTYDADNRVATETDAEGRVTQYEYDPMGRVTKVTTPDGYYSRAEYDKDGRLIYQFDKNNQATAFEYDEAGRRVAVTDARNAVTRMTYWDNGLLKTVADPKGNVTTYEYDDLGRRTRIIGPAPASRVWQTDYDKSGNIVRTTDPDGRTATYGYDWANRLTSIAWSDGQSVSYVLDGNGNRSQVTDNTGTTTYTYDELDRIKTVTDPNGQTVTYTWDGVGNLVTLGYPGGLAVSYQYDSVDRLWRMTDWASRATTWTLDRSDRITQVAYPGGVTTTLGYLGGRLQSQATRRSDNSVIASWNLTRDGNGNITDAAVQLPLLPAIVSGTSNRSYDADNRQAGITHDAAGRVTNNGAHSFGWNARDQITAIDGNAQLYNAEGMRVAQTVGGVTTRFVMDRAGKLPNVLMDTDAANTPQRYYLHSPYGLVQQIDAAGNPRWYHYDTNGNTLALTNASGQVTDSYAYTPFGETTASGATPNPFRFVGQYGVRNFNNSELYDMRARWYSAEQGRFLSLDPLLGETGRPQSLNRYAYVEGNPVGGIDPSGLTKNDFLAQMKEQITDKMSLLSNTWSGIEAANASYGRKLSGGTAITLAAYGKDVVSAGKVYANGDATLGAQKLVGATSGALAGTAFGAGVVAVCTAASVGSLGAAAIPCFTFGFLGGAAVSVGANLGTQYVVKNYLKGPVAVWNEMFGDFGNMAYSFTSWQDSTMANSIDYQSKVVNSPEALYATYNESRARWNEAVRVKTICRNSPSECDAAMNYALSVYGNGIRDDLNVIGRGY